MVAPRASLRYIFRGDTVHFGQETEMSRCSVQFDLSTDPPQFSMGQWTHGREIHLSCSAKQADDLHGDSRYLTILRPWRAGDTRCSHCVGYI